MKQKLAKQLKEAGFTQRKWKYAFYYVKGLKNKAGEDMIVLYCDLYNFKGEKVYFPTLSELIEACGEDNKPTIRPWNIFEWQASVPHKTLRKITQGVGKTPEEAVANLWLELNKK